MYDPKFEKAIQQKMEELEFRPPESVWVNIEKVVVTKRRRRTGLLWRYLLPGVLVVAAAGLYWHHGTNKLASRPAVEITGGSAADNGGTMGSTADNGAGSGSATSRPAGGQDAAAGSTELAGHSSAGLSARGFGSSQSAGTNQWRNTGHAGAAGHSIRAGEMRGTNESSTAGGKDGNGRVPVAGQTGAFGGTAAAGQDGSAGAAGQNGQTGLAGSAGRMQPAGQNGLASWFYLPGLADQRLTPQVHAAALNTKKSNSLALAGLSHPQRRWEAGFVAGGGLSRLNRLNSGQARVALDPATTSFYAISNAASPSSNSHYISDVRTEASFEGGIYLQRPLSDRWIINTGMNLHYFSNRISVGQQVTTYVQQPAISLLLANTVQTSSTPSMYSAGDTRSVINKYYFLELPVGLQWKVNKSHLVPIFVEGGVSLSRLMGASALFYNAKTGLYSKEGDIVNKTQFNIESAVLVGLPFHGVNIQLGPQIQYGLTPLANTQGVGDQHLLYTGIRLVVIPGRK